ncbi:MAG: saccharopine dehydrogenase NADP-binding domain-containing protein [Bacteroidia bacterium]|nr:saccharopine dehydrogenase NADP-binding domain-containing protein [Bacteroidia bacterium]
MNNSKIILYGSYGYTGNLIAQECRSRNLDIILSGRNEESLKKQSELTNYPFEVVDITDTLALKNLLAKGKVVIHCGGPFQYTARAMAIACMETNTHYTDITGESAVFEMLSTFDDQGKHAGITIMPGTGFDVVPSDCLAVYLKNKLPSATHLQLAFASTGGGFSRGTAKTMIEGLGYPSMIRRDGKLTAVRTGSLTKEIDYGPFKIPSLNIPWGDISTAWRSTGIPNIEVYIGSNNNQIAYARNSNYINWLLRLRWVKDFLKKKIDKKPAGPSGEKRLKGKMYLVGRVWDGTGKESSARLETIDGYTLTAKASVLIVEKILSGNFKTGYQTPAMAYGDGLILEIPGSKLTDL